MSITMIHSGVRTNIIPAEAQLQGTVRVFEDRVEREVEQRTREIAEGIARGGGGTVEVSFEQGYPVVLNDAPLHQSVIANRFVC
jgi:metal-dependent amidase/aminoacylase/carboxypeptidase family protein